MPGRRIIEGPEPHRRQEFVFIQADLPQPLRSSPVRFAVRLKDGSAGSLWKVEARGKGDVYIVPRDIMEGAKISLHASGQQHFKFHHPPWDKMEWEEPPRESPLLASMKLLFTVWSAGMGPTRNYDAAQVGKMWTESQAIIEGEDSEDMAISVSFFLTRPGADVRLFPHPSMATFAVVPVGAGKDLYITARREHRPNLRAAIEEKLNETINSKAIPVRWPIGRRSLLLLAGDDVDGRPYVAPVSVEMKAHGAELIRCRQLLVVAPNYQVKRHGFA